MYTSTALLLPEINDHGLPSNKLMIDKITSIHYVTVLIINVEQNDLVNMKYVTITSSDVERSFPMYINIFAPIGMSFTENNLIKNTYDRKFIFNVKLKFVFRVKLNKCFLLLCWLL